MAKEDIRVLIDGTLTAEKTLAGEPKWEREEAAEGPHNHDAMRWLVPLMIGGELCHHMLTVKAYPNRKTLMFRIILSFDKAVFRTDFAEDEPHQNSFDAPSDIAGIIVRGPHYHSWEDNRRFATLNSLPVKLHNARTLPVNIRTFENAYRWFCGAIGIANVDTFGIPVLPRPSKLL